MQEQEIRKESPRLYKFFWARLWSPSRSRKYWGMKIDILMDNFVGMMKTLNEKKEIITIIPKQGHWGGEEARKKNDFDPREIYIAEKSWVCSGEQCIVCFSIQKT